jgi:hypothetical protein
MAGVKGKSGGVRPNSGRKSRAEEMGLAALLDKCWSVADREACIRSLAKQASQGDIDAVKLLLSYAFGKPKESVDVQQSGRIEVLYVNDWRS